MAQTPDKTQDPSDISKSDRVAEQTGIRKALLKNGYVPLANVDLSLIHI